MSLFIATFPIYTSEHAAPYHYNKQYRNGAFKIHPGYTQPAMSAHIDLLLVHNINSTGKPFQGTFSQHPFPHHLSGQVVHISRPGGLYGRNCRNAVALQPFFHRLHKPDVREGAAPRGGSQAEARCADVSRPTVAPAVGVKSGFRNVPSEQ